MNFTTTSSSVDPSTSSTPLSVPWELGSASSCCKGQTSSQQPACCLSRASSSRPRSSSTSQVYTSMPPILAKREGFLGVSVVDVVPINIVATCQNIPLGLVVGTNQDVNQAYFTYFPRRQTCSRRCLREAYPMARLLTMQRTCLGARFHPQASL